MTARHEDLRDEIVRAGRLLHAAGLAPSTSGNISLRVDGGILVTPTNSRLGALESTDVVEVADDGTVRSVGTPSKEAPLHIGMYRARPDCRAIVHVHALHCVAVSCLATLDPDDALPPLTAYYLMRLGAVGLVGFHPPGSPDLAVEVSAAAVRRRALLLANHGAIIAARSLDDALADTEELEQAAALHLMLRDAPTRLVPERFHAQLRRRAAYQPATM
jgi:ribulose-5-phosphate 4-epimerase/fuculose-1-phosphate aldolase